MIGRKLMRKITKIGKCRFNPTIYSTVTGAVFFTLNNNTHIKHQIMNYKISIQAIGIVREAKDIDSALWAFLEHVALQKRGFGMWDKQKIMLLDKNDKIIKQYPEEE